MKNWLITGCSSGLGRSLARAVLDRGWNVTATSRTITELEGFASDAERGRCHIMKLDVTKPDDILGAVASAQQRFGAVDVLVNNAGYGFRSAVEEADDADLRALFETNFFGLVRLTQAVLPLMRARRHGSIVNVSSVAGRLTLSGNGLYSATKFAVEGISDALRKEVAPLGLKVMLVEPGPFRTQFAGTSLHQSAHPIDDYAETAGFSRKENSRIDGNQPGDPDRAAACIIDGLLADPAPFRLVLGDRATHRVEEELDAQLAELRSWRWLSSKADFPSE
jgi:NAD(P)-dependent dehydrogenase (short-subunit alcohol dehydrogenase family)